jgi:hypothetical protein
MVFTDDAEDVNSKKKPAKIVCTTESGASPKLPCIFPFRFNGVVHTQCTWDQAHLTEHKAWCSTLVDETGHHVGGQGKWGNCGPDCPVPPDDRNETTSVPGRTEILQLLKLGKCIQGLETSLTLDGLLSSCNKVFSGLCNDKFIARRETFQNTTRQLSIIALLFTIATGHVTTKKMIS